ncbi:MAG TPA: ATPase [Methanocorpusculum sp.]|nr:ATPase [Methanocorpusculum sp.]HJJ40186.1 ATPase [Methanocorpusculum sp.]HJJ49575.1 ATPase [Methanocorpusculum sp.]HJJ57660.1 ATPase [Methanocorpusculum sp.]
MAIEALINLESAAALAKGLGGIGAGLAVGLAGIGTGIGEQGIGAAAVGATAEDRGMFGLALLFTVLPETVVIFGLVIALLIMFL